jgi:hypothetical protein
MINQLLRHPWQPRPALRTLPTPTTRGARPPPAARPQDADPALRANHDTVFEYCPGSLPLNFVLMNNVVGFGGCGVVSGRRRRRARLAAETVCRCSTRSWL